MTKVDFKKELKHLYKPSPKEVVIVDVPEMSFLMIDGVGDPNTAQEYKDAIEALYSVSYALKFMVKKGEYSIQHGKQRPVEMDKYDYATRVCNESIGGSGSGPGCEKEDLAGSFKREIWKFSRRVISPDHAHWPIFC